MRSIGRCGSHRLRIRRRFSEKALITFPFHDPAANRAMTVADKLRVEQRRSPCVRWMWARRRMRRAHDPSGLRGRRPRLRRHPQHQSGRHLKLARPMSACGWRQDRAVAPRPRLPARRRPPHRRRARRRPSATRVDIGRAHLTRRARIQTEFGKSAHRERARFNFREILPDPDHRTPRRRPSLKSRDEAGRHTALPSGSANTSCTAPMAKPALQRSHPHPHVQRHPARRSTPRQASRGARCCRAKLASVFVRAAAHDPPKCEQFGDNKMGSALGRKTGSRFC